MAGFWDSIKRKAPAPYSTGTDAMLQVFLSDLEVRYKFLDPQVGDDPATEALLGQIEDRLSALRQAESRTEDAAWTEAHALESMLALAAPLPNILSEVRLRLDQAGAEGASAVPRLAGRRHRGRGPCPRQEYRAAGLRSFTVPFQNAPADSGPVPDGQLHQILPSQQLALLAIWCFLAGFSERLVPSILSSTEQQLSVAARGPAK